jgi:hypothetical protein
MMSLLQPQVSAAPSLGDYVHSKWGQTTGLYGIAAAEDWSEWWWNPGTGAGLLTPSTGVFPGLAMSCWVRCWDTDYDVSGGSYHYIGPVAQICCNQSSTPVFAGINFRNAEGPGGIKGVGFSWWAMSGLKGSTIAWDDMTNPIPAWDSSGNLTGNWFWVSCSLWGRHRYPYSGVVRWHIGDEDGNIQSYTDPQSSINLALTQNGAINSTGHAIALAHPGQNTTGGIIVDRRGPFDICQLRYYWYHNTNKNTVVIPYSSDWWDAEHWRYRVDLDLEEDDLAVHATLPDEEYWMSRAGWTLDNVTDGLVETQGIDGSGDEMTFVFGDDGEWGNIGDGPALLTR